MSKKQPAPTPPADPFQSIDPTALGTVSGGAGANAEVMTALTGILDSVKSLASSQQSSGFDPTTMMMMMMMMGQRNAGPVVAQPANPYAGYTIDGVFYPFK
jgi:hypothetical protein